MLNAIACCRHFTLRERKQLDFWKNEKQLKQFFSSCSFNNFIRTLVDGKTLVSFCSFCRGEGDSYGIWFVLSFFPWARKGLFRHKNLINTEMRNHIIHSRCALLLVPCTKKTLFCFLRMFWNVATFRAIKNIWSVEYFHLNMQSSVEKIFISNGRVLARKSIYFAIAKTVIFPFVQ